MHSNRVDADRQVAINSALIDLQRSLIDYLYDAGEDTKSAIAVLDKLLLALALSVNRRQRARLANGRQADAA